jgi:hypothetical protein
VEGQAFSGARKFQMLDYCHGGVSQPSHLHHHHAVDRTTNLLPRIAALGLASPGRVYCAALSWIMFRPPDNWILCLPFLLRLATALHRPTSPSSQASSPPHALAHPPRSGFSCVVAMAVCLLSTLVIPSSRLKLVHWSRDGWFVPSRDHQGLLIFFSRLGITDIAPLVQAQD